MTRSWFCVCVGALLAIHWPVHGADWPQFGYDAAHSGNNRAEATITAANVSQIVQYYVRPLYPLGVIDGAPVYTSSVTTPAGVKDLLFAFGANGMYDGMGSAGTLFAFDAATGSVVWSQQTTGSSQHASSSPAIDPNRQYVYSFGLDGYVHKYQIGDGAEVITVGPVQFGWPVQVTLKPDQEKVASSLTIATSNGSSFLEVVTNGYDGDGGDYQGHLVSINLNSTSQSVFNAMCSNQTNLLEVGVCTDRMSGIWGRAGATFDATTNRLYVTTGNGHFTANSGGFDWGDSVLALPVDGSSTGGMPLDSYTPTNFQDLDNFDIDLGSVSLAILSAPAASAIQNLGVQSGKGAELHLINLDDMSGAGAPGHVGGELQLLTAGDSFAQPAVWVNNADSSTWLFTGDVAAGFRLALSGNQPILSLIWSDNSSAVTSPIVANGVVYYLARASGGAAFLMARDALTGNLLWQSSLLQNGLHWQSPIVVDGAIYLFDYGALYKFGPDHIFGNGFEGG